VKKLLALAIVGGIIALTAGCPPASTPPGTTKVNPPASSAKTADKTNTHEGKVVKTAEGKLTMKGKDDKEMTHDISKDAKIMVDGTAAKLEDLKAGQEITVTTDDKGVVTKVDAKKAAVEPPKPEIKTHKGKVVKVDGGKLTMKGDDDKEHMHDLKDVTITRDGKPAKPEDLKADDELTVTTEDGKVTKIEAKAKK
jgi:hypothetical protein